MYNDYRMLAKYVRNSKLCNNATIGGETGLGNLTTSSFQQVANNVTGITLKNTGHFIPEERPNFLTKQILKFFK
jgi:hypothetical protein